MGEMLAPRKLRRRIDWVDCLGYALLAAVLAVIAKPVWEVLELLCFFSQMGTMNG
jgi:hypothetical protein